jgi:hypothetical protein
MTGPTILAGERTPIMNATDFVESQLFHFFFLPQQNLLQPLWDFILAHGQPFVSHWLFAGWLTLVGFTLICSYFTYKGSDIFLLNYIILISPVFFFVQI